MHGWCTLSIRTPTSAALPPLPTAEHARDGGVGSPERPPPGAEQPAVRPGHSLLLDPADQHPAHLTPPPHPPSRSVNPLAPSLQPYWNGC